MARPFSGVSCGAKYAYNFYHSQVCIIECAFVVALVKLHNFCIDENDLDIIDISAADKLRTELQGGVPLERSGILPCQLIGAL
eukprot:scaffold194498_cov75-Attheya_sp.AAC.1